MNSTEAANAPLADRVAIVTGGGTGIGKAIALRFAAAGATVVVSGRTPETIQAVAAQANGQAVAADVAVEAEVERLFSSTHTRFGRIDILVNNAGGPGPIAPVADMEVAEWDTCVAINLRGAMLCMKYAARIMTRQRSGSIINMSSLMGLEGYPMRTAYCATKFAMIGMTEAVAREVGPYGVRVNALCPGAVSGENMDRVIARRAAAEGRDPADIIRESYTDVAALKRWVTPEEVAEAALFLAGDASSAMTGDRMKVDAGRF